MTGWSRRPLATGAKPQRSSGERPEPPGGPDWRAEMRGASGANILAGLWIVISPWTLDYSRGGPLVNAVVTGGLIALIALMRVAGAYRASWLSWINAFLGGWLATSAFLVTESGIALWNNLVFGVTVLGLACWSARASELRGGTGNETP